MKRNLLLAISLLLLGSWAFSQTTVTGVVTSAEDGSTLPGVSVVVKGTVIGTTTDVDGEYSIDVPEDNNRLVFTYVGMKIQEVKIDDRTTVNVGMQPGVQGLDEVVVTAIGIEREKKSLGYATQDVSGEEVSQVKNTNFMNSLSGKVAGVNIRKSNQLGGSSNILIRGYKSITGNNQPLFVVDGTPISNDITNTSDQQTGRGGFDFGNAAMDINPEDIEDISILRGSAATALYGSRAANGVVLITTKKGTDRKGLGVTVKTGYTNGTIDRSTMPVYQTEYGAGYGRYYGGPSAEEAGDNPAFDYDGPADADIQGYFEPYDVDGDGLFELAVPMGEDASYGAPFNSDLMVYGWESIHPELSTYGEAQPWEAAQNLPHSFYQPVSTFNNSVAVEGGNELGTYRLSYTNYNQTGMLPNSKLKRNNITFKAGYNLSDRLNVRTSGSYTNTDGLGRYGTGYDQRNPNQSFRQWYSVNTDIMRQKEAYDQTGKNLSWNPYGYGRADSAGPHYFDNYYFGRYENFSTDERNRFFGNAEVNYQINDWLDVVGRFSIDNYSELQEERIAIGSIDIPMYERYNRNFTEVNYDAMLSFNKYFGADDILNLNGNVGTNIRRTHVDAVRASTNGGLIAPNIFSLSNSVNPINPPEETNYMVGVNGYFAQASFGYDQFLYLDLTGRYDISSTLPDGDNGYFYPSASLSFVFSEILDVNGLDFGKFRINYAQVGSSAPPLSLENRYVLGTAFVGVPRASVSATDNNATLKPENTRSYEAGLELNFLQNRAGLDFSVYQSNTFNQIIPVAVTGATGVLRRFVNAGNIQNRGIELALFGTPVETEDFSWRINANWAMNRNTVVELFEDQTNLQLATAQGGISVNATVDEPYGAIWGTNFVTENNERVVTPHPFGGMMYARTTSPEVIGNINPDWNGGVQNVFRYRDFSLSFLIDIQKGGDFFSLDTYYGFATGLYDITAGTNEKGNPVRDLPSEGGGFEIGGVVQTGTDSEGNPIYEDNEEYGWASNYANSMGYAVTPNALHIYDASYVKLREVALSYRIPQTVFENSAIQGAEVSLVGNNLWIIHKNSPYTDPEAGLSAGNIQGNQSGAYPSVREFGINLRINL